MDLVYGHPRRRSQKHLQLELDQVFKLVSCSNPFAKVLCTTMTIMTKENQSVRYTYVRHPLCPEWCITIARTWDNEEKTALRITWCANKAERGFSHRNALYTYFVLEKFDRKKSHKICMGRFKSKSSYVVMTLPKPYVRGDGPELVPQIIEFVEKHPALPGALKKLLRCAAAADYESLSSNKGLSEVEYIKCIRLLTNTATTASVLDTLPPNCS